MNCERCGTKIDLSFRDDPPYLCWRCVKLFNEDGWPSNYSYNRIGGSDGCYAKKPEETSSSSSSRMCSKCGDYPVSGSSSYCTYCDEGQL